MRKRELHSVNRDERRRRATTVSASPSDECHSLGLDADLQSVVDQCVADHHSRSSSSKNDSPSLDGQFQRGDLSLQFDVHRTIDRQSSVRPESTTRLVCPSRLFHGGCRQCHLLFLFGHRHQSILLQCSLSATIFIDLARALGDHRPQLGDQCSSPVDTLSVR